MRLTPNFHLINTNGVLLKVTPLRECPHNQRPPPFPVRAQRFYHLPHLCLCTTDWFASVWRVTGRKYSLFFISITPFLTPLPSPPSVLLFLSSCYSSTSLILDRGEKVHHTSANILRAKEREASDGKETLIWVFVRMCRFCRICVKKTLKIYKM